MKKILAFGTFDTLHEGHVYFLAHAKQLGDHLTVVLPHDATVTELKNKQVKHPLESRMQNLATLGIANEILPGDRIQGNWNVVRTIQPHIIAIGHDQDGLLSALEHSRDSFDFTLQTKKIDKLG